MAAGPFMGLFLFMDSLGGAGHSAFVFSSPSRVFGRGAHLDLRSGGESPSRTPTGEALVVRRFIGFEICAWALAQRTDAFTQYEWSG